MIFYNKNNNKSCVKNLVKKGYSEINYPEKSLITWKCNRERNTGNSNSSQHSHKKNSNAKNNDSKY